MPDPTDKAAPMASAPMKYQDDGLVDWGNMWDSFCELPRNGGPPHRPTVLTGDEQADPTSPAYQAVVAEIRRGIGLVSGLAATPATPGWIAIACPSPGMARWLADAIREENVAARWPGDATVLVPAGPDYTLKGEIKNVVTAVAKTTHYWADHVAPDVQRALDAQVRLDQIKQRVQGFFSRGKR